MDEAVDALLAPIGAEAPTAAHGALRLRTAVSPDEPAAELRAVEGDFFALTRAAADALGLPRFGAAFDRGSLVAIAPDDRAAYAATLSGLMAPGGRVLLVTVEHDPFEGGKLGPPYEVTEASVRALFGEHFAVELLQWEDRIEREPAWRQHGCTRFAEAAYLLTRRSDNRENIVARLLGRGG